jgi:hypothetical protein
MAGRKKKEEDSLWRTYRSGTDHLLDHDRRDHLPGETRYDYLSDHHIIAIIVVVVVVVVVSYDATSVSAMLSRLAGWGELGGGASASRRR